MLRAIGEAIINNLPLLLTSLLAAFTGPLALWQTRRLRRLSKTPSGVVTKEAAVERSTLRPARSETMVELQALRDQTSAAQAQLIDRLDRIAAPSVSPGDFFALLDTIDTARGMRRKGDDYEEAAVRAARQLLPDQMPPGAATSTSSDPPKAAG